MTLIGCYIMYKYFKDPEIFRAFVDEHYILGVLVVEFLFIIQVICALIPGGALQVAAGYAFGSLEGAIISLIGILLGSFITLLLVRKFGRPFAELFNTTEKLESMSFMRDKKKRNILTFVVFLIPGMPKDLLTYFIGLTDMSIPLYLLITGIARFPAIWMSTAGGDALGLEKYSHALYFFIIIAVVSIIGVLLYKRFKQKNK